MTNENLTEIEARCAELRACLETEFLALVRWLHRRRGMVLVIIGVALSIGSALAPQDGWAHVLLLLAWAWALDIGLRAILAAKEVQP